MRLSERLRNIIVGLVGLSLFVAVTTIGVQHAFGYFDATYRVEGVFSSAGQGLIAGSDVKMRGINVGEVAGVELVERQALVKMDIDDGERIPVGSTAVIRPKTLFGEKFVDLVAEDAEAEAEGPFLQPGDRIEDTLGGFELERVLSDTYPILQAIDPAELAVVLGELAEGGRDLGPTINQGLVDGSKVLDVYARHDADTRQLLDDLALLSDELDRRAGDLISGARSLRSALPPLIEREDELTTLLDQAARLSSDLADVFESNRGFLTKSITVGGRSVEALHEGRDRIRPLIIGLRQYVQTIAESVSIPVGDGTMMARVRGIMGGEPCGEGLGESCFVPAPQGGATSTAVEPSGPLASVPSLPIPLDGTDGIDDLLRSALGR